MLTPLEIQNKKFKKEFRGYDPVEVDQFMAEAAKSYELLIHEMMDLKDNIERLLKGTENKKNY